MNKQYIIALLLIIVYSMTTVAQDTTALKEHKLNFRTQYFQIKEGANYGLVFNGFNLVIGYDYNHREKRKVFNYSPDFAFGPDFRQGIGLNWHFKPVDLFYGWDIAKNSQNTIYLGPYLSVNYQWQLYPELQSGHMFWFTFIDFGPKIFAEFPISNKKMRIIFSNSIAGFASRPTPATESHFYSLTMSDFVNNAHSNIKFGTCNLLNHTNLEIIFIEINKKRLSLGYEFEYFVYYENPRLDYMTHSLNMYWNLGHKKTK
ncbi:hypothetical protein ACFLU5_07735 [Bacteroidota bacterium]